LRGKKKNARAKEEKRSVVKGLLGRDREKKKFVKGRLNEIGFKKGENEKKGTARRTGERKKII